MEKGLLTRIFEPFEQGGASISHSYGGSGLGLAISSNLVSLMNGHISVSSTPGVGSEFVVELPLLTVPDNTPKQDVSLEDIRVLVVDDDLVTCEHTTLILNRIGVDAEYVTSGKAAVTRVKSALQRHTCYNIALVDWKMPDMDGVETARSIRRIVGPDTLVIIMSAYDWTEIEARHVRRGWTSSSPNPYSNPSCKTYCSRPRAADNPPPRFPCRKRISRGDASCLWKTMKSIWKSPARCWSSATLRGRGL